MLRPGSAGNADAGLCREPRGRHGVGLTRFKEKNVLDCVNCQHASLQYKTHGFFSDVLQNSAIHQFLAGQSSPSHPVSCECVTCRRLYTTD